jgi:lipopolysaccharide transport system permease protein
MNPLFDLRNHFEAVRDIVTLLTKHRQLTWEMTKREITQRYVGQVFGTLWTVGHPIALMLIYILVFNFVFRMKIGGSRELPLDYTTYLLSGMIPWLTFQDLMSKSTTVITGDASLVKQLVFPIEVLPVKSVLSSLPAQLVATLLLCIYILFANGMVPVTVILFPLLLSLQILGMIGVGYLFSSIGVFFRDLKDFVQVFCTAGLFIIPVLYLPKNVPRIAQPILYMNPFSYLVWCYQDVFYFGRFEHWWAWIVFTTMSLGVFYFGYRVFRKLKVMFGNVL